MHPADPSAPNGATNKFCSLRNLRNESVVEQFFVFPLLVDLGYSSDYIATKTTIPQRTIGKGRKRKSYAPDYEVFARKSKDKPVLVVDAKHPDESAEEGVQDAQLYASPIRRRMPPPKPEQYCIGVNGHLLIVKHYNSDTAEHVLTFADFVDGSPKFDALRRELSRDAVAARLRSRADAEWFEFRKVTPSDLPSIFERCHRKIWKAEKRGPADAFHEFAKLMYVKIDEDRRLRERIAAMPAATSPEGYVPKNAVRFAEHWIVEMEETTQNPIQTILFARLAQEIEEQILRKEKKRIFEEDEGIELAPSTIKEVVKLLEHLDLFAVDEDLNGRLFETFLTATMRGEALGQFFTPRSVVKFVVDLARLRATPSFMDTILDGCCGTGGFLIQAMAVMSDSLNANRSLSSTERSASMRRLRTEALWGIDAGQKPPIA